MSVKTMGLVWDLDNGVIDREEKYVLLAYADHADHEGRNMFPSIELICKKTGYKERSVQAITRSLEEKGFLVNDGQGPKGTNKWSYGGGAKIAGVQETTEGGAKVTGQGVQPTAPEPLRTIKEPSIKDGADAPQMEQPPRDERPKSPKANQIPEVVLFRDVTKRYPPSANFEDVVASVKKVGERLNRAVEAEDLLKFYKAWTSKGYNPSNLAWLQWAEAGQVPVNGNWKPRSDEPKGFDAARSFLERHSNVNS